MFNLIQFRPIRDDELLTCLEIGIRWLGATEHGIFRGIFRVVQSGEREKRAGRGEYCPHKHNLWFPHFEF